MRVGVGVERLGRAVRRRADGLSAFAVGRRGADARQHDAGVPTRRVPVESAARRPAGVQQHARRDAAQSTGARRRPAGAARRRAGAGDHDAAGLGEQARRGRAQEAGRVATPTIPAGTHSTPSACVSSCAIPLMPVVRQVVGFGRGDGRRVVTGGA